MTVEGKWKEDSLPWDGQERLQRCGRGRTFSNKPRDSVTGNKPQSRVVVNTQVLMWGNTVDGGYQSPRENKGGGRTGRTRDMMA